MYRIFMIGYSQNKGGVETYISNLTNNLDHSEFEVVYSMPRMTINGKTWIRPATRHNYLKYRAFWKRFYKANHFDVLYFNTCDIVSTDQLKFAKAAGVPVRIIHAHSSGNQQGVDRKMSLFHRLSEKRSRKTIDQYATHLFACSKAAGDWMFDGRPFQIIKNGIQLSKYRFDEKKRERIRKEYGYCQEKLIGIIGRLEPPKNPLFAVQVLEEVLKNDDVKAVFLGDGTKRQETEDAVKKAGLEHRVQFVGAVDNIFEWVSAVDCLLMTSLFEGLPFVLIEAQAAGLPCIVSSSVSREANITGLLEYVSLKADKKSWAEKIEDACQNTARRDTSQQLIDAGYSIEETASTVMSIIGEAL